MAVISSQKPFTNSSQSVSSAPKLAANKVVNSSYNVGSIVDSLGSRYYNQSNVFQGAIKLRATAYIHGYAHDYLSSLVRFFGEGFRQDTNYFYINKATLPGLIPHSQNTAESLLTGLLLRIKEYESNNLISKITVEHWKTTYIGNYQAKILLIKLYADVKYSYTFTSVTGTERGFILNANEKPTINDF